MGQNITMMEVAAAYPALALAAGAGAAAQSIADDADDAAPEFFDGPLIAAWLREQGAWPTNDTLARKARYWRAGHAASLAALDRMLVDTNLTLEDVPVGYGVPDPNRNPDKGGGRGGLRPHTPDDVKRRAVAAYLKSGPKHRRTIKSVAAQFDVHPSSLKRWAGRVERGEL